MEKSETDAISAGAFTDETMVAPIEGLSSPPVALTGQSFEQRYESRARLGEGGMGEVLVYRDRVIGREIAIKKIRGGLPVDASHEARFLREARVQGQLEHPAIVPVYDMGRDRDGAAYFGMKRVRGLTLQQMIAELPTAGPRLALPARRRLITAFSTVCLAVDFAHKRGVLHRDLKPSNIMLGDFGEVYVLDWGIAKVRGSDDNVPPNVAGSAPTLGDPASDPSARTIDGVTLGTAGYMSPEQVSCDRLDERSDVYCLGVMLFEVLALEPLHKGETLRHLLTSTLRGSDARPSSRPLGGDVPPELDAICVKATALEPKERFATARELHDSIEAYLAGDRDLARRRELADGHARSAAEAVERARSTDGPADDRSRAMSDVGRALALDPQNLLALKSLVELVTQPPRVLPNEAQEELAAAGQRTAAVFARSGPLGVAGVALCMPLFFWQGVKSWPALLVLVALWAALGWARRSKRGTLADGTLPIHIPVIGFSAAAATSMLFGPFVLVPVVAMVLAVNAAMAPGRSRRALITALALASFVVPWILQLAGIAPRVLSMAGDPLTAPSLLFDVRDLPTHVALLATNVTVLLVGITIAFRLRQRLYEAEHATVLQSWQLRQLIPQEARAVAYPAQGDFPRDR